MPKTRLEVRRELAFVIAVGAVAGAACGGSETNPGGAGQAGSAATSGWTYLPPGSDAGTFTGTGGTGGSGGGSGASSVAGSSGSGGGNPAPSPFSCSGIVPNRPGVTSFDAFTQDRWTGPSNIGGGVYIYPEPFVLKPGDFLRYSDAVATYSGLGVWFAGCVDASKMMGIRFSMAGTVGSSASVQFYLIVNRNRDIDQENLVGACAPADPQNTWESCRPPGIRLPVTQQPTIQSVLWSDLTGGLPMDKTNGSDILALQWSFDWGEGDPSYPADLTIDDLEFIPAEDTGMGGAGGAGGAPDGQSGAPPTDGAAGEGGAAP